MADDKVILSRDAYPGNSAKGKKGAAEEKEPRQKRDAVANAKRVKKTFIQRLKGTFNEGEAGSEVISYVIHDVVIPAAKSTFADLVEGAIEMVLFGSDRRGGSRVRREGSRSYVTSYESMYRGAGRREDSRHSRDRHVARHDFTGVILESRSEGEHVLNEMAMIIEQYNLVTVADLYELVGISAEFTDQNFGWPDLENASVRRVREGWTLDLPRPKVID
jgi:hypothetical protein